MELNLHSFADHYLLLILLIIGTCGVLYFIFRKLLVTGKSVIDNNWTEFWFRAYSEVLNEKRDLESKYERDTKILNSNIDHQDYAMGKLAEENLDLKTANDNYKWVVDHYKLGSHIEPSISSIGYQGEKV